MKKLFTFAFALCATLAASAQLPDPSTWEAGQDVTAILGLGDVDGTFSGEREENSNGDYTPSTMGDYWKGSKPSEWNYLEAQETGALAFYFDGKAQGPLTDIYQVVYFPAGYYTLKIQALYREGTPVDNFNNHFNGVIKKNAWIYADILAGDSAGSAVTREFTKYVRSLATSEQTERLYYDSDGSWKNDASGVYHQGEEDEVTYWCPCCLPGTITYFANGRYWNEMTVALTEGAYVRLGLKKTANIAQDWLAFSNLTIIYNGEMTPEIEKQLAYEDFQARILALEEVRDKANEIGFGALYGIIDDKMMELDDAVTGESTLEEIIAGQAAVDAAIDGFNNSIQFALQLNDLLSMSADMLASTDFSGKAAFQAAYDDAYAKAHTDDPEEINYDAATYGQIYTKLAQDRANYLLTSPQDENGAWDFTSLIKNPWFVNPENTPVKLDDGTWCIQQDGSTDLWRHYVVAQGATNPNNVYNNGRVNVTSKVVLSPDETVTNTWYKVVNYTQGWSNGLNLMYQGALIGVSDGWNTGLEGTLEIRQQLVGLPNGYYNLKGLMRGNETSQTITWNANNLPPYHNIFAQNSDETVVKSPVGSTDSYYSPQYGWYEWNANVWQEHKTSIIQVADGKLLIGGQSSMIMNVTGFRLGFYGENPDFNGMIQEELDAIAPKLEALLFKGDKTEVQALLDQIQLPLASPADYETALGLTRQANDYIQKAQSATNGFDVEDRYNNLATNYEDGTPQAGILAPAQEFVAAFMDAAETTYDKAAPVKDVCGAYESYIAAYDKAEALDYVELNDILAEQATALKAGYSDKETLNAYQARLEEVMPLATIIMLGGANASPENPLDVTTLIKNPTFTNGTGDWSGTGATQNEYARGNAEIWNQNTFDFYQVLKSMPVGKYQLKVRALYRDSRNVTDDYIVAKTEGEGNDTIPNKCYYTWWNLAEGNADTWIDNFAELYMSTGADDTLVESASKVKSVCDGKFTEPSFVGFFSLPDAGYTVGQGGKFLFYEELNEADMATVETDPETGEIIYDNVINNTAAQDYPFDEKVFEDGVIYYYPSSMAGVAKRFEMSPEAYCNSVDFEITETADLRLGLRKSQGFSGDWVIFDDFQLFYLGGELPPTAINEVANTAKASQNAIYNIAGQRVANTVKGLYIVNGKKVYVK